jgi:hypothetical protein
VKMGNVALTDYGYIVTTRNSKGTRLVELGARDDGPTRS